MARPDPTIAPTPPDCHHFAMLHRPPHIHWLPYHLPPFPHPTGKPTFKCPTPLRQARVLKPDGIACMAFTNRCFPTKVVPIWKQPFTDVHHAEVVAAYFRYSSPEWADVGVADVSPDGWTGQRDPAIVVIGRKRKVA
jgi:hypothetical protein